MPREGPRLKGCLLRQAGPPSYLASRVPQHHNEALELSSGATTPFHNDHESMELYRCPVEELIMGNMSHSGNRLKTYHLPGEYSAVSLSRQLFGSIQWEPVLHNNGPQGASDETSWA